MLLACFNCLKADREDLYRGREMIRFVFYANRPEIFSQEISHIQSLLIQHNTELLIINDRAKLILLIPQLCQEKSVAILCASTTDELDDLMMVREEFASIPTVLVLPDDHTETFQRGMLLNPLYFMARQDDLRHVSLAINELCHCYGFCQNKDSLSSPFGQDRYKPLTH